MRLAAPQGQARTLSLEGARMLAGELRDAVARRHALAVARVGHDKRCCFDLHALVPVPSDILWLGPDHPDALQWLWERWGTTETLRHVALAPDRDETMLEETVFRVSFWVADWTPWRALSRHQSAVSGAAVRRATALRAGLRAIMTDAVPIAAPEAWEDAPRRQPASAAPVLAVAGFEGPLDWLLQMARAQRIDLATLSIVDLVDAFVAALDAALSEHIGPRRPVALGRVAGHGGHACIVTLAPTVAARCPGSSGRAGRGRGDAPSAA